MDPNEPVHPIFRDAPEPQAILWRYLSFARFISLLHSAQLHFTRIDGFDDHFEGAWPQKDVDYWKHEKLLRAFDVVSFTEDMRCNAAVSCWIEIAT